jgi:hypothetical protein
MEVRAGTSACRTRAERFACVDVVATFRGGPKRIEVPGSKLAVRAPILRNVRKVPFSGLSEFIFRKQAPALCLNCLSEQACQYNSVGKLNLN